MAKPRAGKKPSRRGRVPGVDVPSTPKMRAASRTNAWKSGLYARRVSVVTKRYAELEKTIPGAAEVVGRYHAAIMDGEVGALDEITVGALAETELLRRSMIDAIHTEGVIVEHDLHTKDGVVFGTEKRANPLIEPLHKINATLGHTAPDHLLTRKSRGEGMAVAAQTAAIMRRNEALRRTDKSRMPAPPVPVEVTLVGKVERA
ncbi:MAG: hypothetical protein M3167_06000 [Acidobacteriota bacterium]|nr:hypothetical protein [Acidobacteriota bacterium]